MTTEATLCFIRKDGKVLLQKKAKGLYGEHKYNAPGGKLLDGESLEQGIIREIKEETGFMVSKLINHGKVLYYEDQHQPSWVVHVFSTDQFDGKLTNSREGILEWVDIGDIPYSRMWPSDKHWVPLLLEGKKFKIYYNEKSEKIIKKEIILHSL